MATSKRKWASHNIKRKSAGLEGGAVPAYVQRERPVTSAPKPNWTVNPNQLPPKPLANPIRNPISTNISLTTPMRKSSKRK